MSNYFSKLLEFQIICERLSSFDLLFDCYLGIGLADC